MGYYHMYGFNKGDFYEGSRGDPGFFSFLGKVAKGALGIASSIMPGGAAVSGMVQKALPGRIGGMVSRVGGAIARHPVLSAAGAAGAGMALPGAIHAGRRGIMREARAMGIAGRRHRRMRVTNPKALRRAIRRTQGFAKLAMRTIHLVHPKKHARFGGFKKRRRRAA
jgi:hypothetical protein